MDFQAEVTFCSTVYLTVSDPYWKQTIREQDRRPGTGGKMARQPPSQRRGDSSRTGSHPQGRQTVPIIEIEKLSP